MSEKDHNIIFTTYFTYIQPVVPGQTDQLKVDERLEDVYIGDPAERELTQGIVDWDNCLQFDIVKFYVSSQWCDAKIWNNFSWLSQLTKKR